MLVNNLSELTAAIAATNPNATTNSSVVSYKCSDCGALSASRRMNPYEKDINDIIVFITVCDECYNDRCGDI